ncbi:MAG: hypothetical protein CBC82_07205 [Cellvibrionales bacterium TMED122]|nr:MAG: hypothetical protein CBC82_07205 [Cellvibrionales bacterium TMED122]|tara:strand:- start:3702 stop:4463 length:762 start_codon:yes stop_codon:yes gene_type:complete
MKKNKKHSGYKFKSYSDKEVTNYAKLQSFFEKAPLNREHILDNVGLFFTSKFLSRILTIEKLYTKILEKEGVIMEFGVRWGQNLSIFTALRAIHEPYNIKRKIIGFDTFTGFPSLSKKDNLKMRTGDLSVPKNYFEYLSNLMMHLEKFNPVSHIKKHELIKGDATKTLKKYLKKNPQTILSLVFFDLDIYKPTKTCLKLLLPHLTKGCVLAFDELNDPISPGETIALKEVFKLKKINLKRIKNSTRISYFVVE